MWWFSLEMRMSFPLSANKKKLSELSASFLSFFPLFRPLNFNIRQPEKLKCLRTDSTMKGAPFFANTLNPFYFRKIIIKDFNKFKILLRLDEKATFRLPSGQWGDTKQFIKWMYLNNFFQPFSAFEQKVGWMEDERESWPFSQERKSQCRKKTNENF